MSFRDDLQRFQIKTKTDSLRLFVNVTQALKESITEGSAVTAAPGQPVDTGFLKNSWQVTFPSAQEALISTNVAYAPVIEHNIRERFDPTGVVNRYGVEGGRIGPALPPGAGRRRRASTVGGHHSVKLTVAGAQRVVQAVLLRMGTGAR